MATSDMIYRSLWIACSHAPCFQGLMDGVSARRGRTVTSNMICHGLFGGVLTSLGKLGPRCSHAYRSDVHKASYFQDFRDGVTAGKGLITKSNKISQGIFDCFPAFIGFFEAKVLPHMDVRCLQALCLAGYGDGRMTRGTDDQVRYDISWHV